MGKEDAQREGEERDAQKGDASKEIRTLGFFENNGDWMVIVSTEVIFHLHELLCSEVLVLKVRKRMS